MQLVTTAGEFLEAGEPQQALPTYLHARDILDGLTDGKEDNADLGVSSARGLAAGKGGLSVQLCNCRATHHFPSRQ